MTAQKMEYAVSGGLGTSGCWRTTSGVQRSKGTLLGISFTDAQIGRLLDALDKSEYAKNTIIVLWSDHGMHIGEKEQWEKFTLWEESTRVPLMIVAPGVTEAGGRCPKPVSLVDIYPTLNELCGLPDRDDIEGVSLLPQLKDPNAERKQPAITTWGKGNHSIRTEHWRYIKHSNGEEELYDHRSDPDEFTNLAKSDPEKWRELMDDMAEWLPKVNADAVQIQK